VTTAGAGSSLGIALAHNGNDKSNSTLKSARRMAAKVTVWGRECIR
jgi:hypothetical protein